MKIYFYLLVFGIIRFLDVLKANKNDEKLKTNSPLVWPTKTREGFLWRPQKIKNHRKLFGSIFGGFSLVTKNSIDMFSVGFF
jgi:hypothetical protein